MKKLIATTIIVLALLVCCGVILVKVMAGAPEAVPPVMEYHQDAQVPHQGDSTVFSVVSLNLAHGRQDKYHQVLLTTPEIIVNLDDITALLTSFFALFVSNVGTTVLLVPLAMNMAMEIGADPKIAGMVVAVASINTFILPTHQVNALIMQPGGYKTSDYMRVGSGLMILFLVILMGMLHFFY